MVAILDERLRLLIDLVALFCFSYRQLQSTHPEQDDTVIRQLATSIEVQACQKVKTRVRTVLVGGC